MEDKLRDAIINALSDIVKSEDFFKINEKFIDKLVEAVLEVAEPLQQENEWLHESLFEEINRGS